MKKFILIVTIFAAIFMLSTITAFAQSSAPIFSAGPTIAQSPTPPDSTPPIVPAVLVAALTLGVSYFVTQGIKSFTDLLARLSQYKWLGWLSGISLSGWGSWITGVIVTAVVFYLDNGFAALPVQYWPIVTMILTGLVAIFGANGLHATVKKFQPVPAQLLKSK
jgi:hypothetical protein